MQNSSDLAHFFMKKMAKNYLWAQPENPADMLDYVKSILQNQVTTEIYKSQLGLYCHVIQPNICSFGFDYGPPFN